MVDNTKLPISILLITFCLAAHADAQNTSKPNIVIIYGDDVGYGDLGAYGSKLIPTPNLDQLASQGLKFNDGHCSALTCTPSRFSMLTGIYGFRYNVRILPPNAPMKIKPEMYTLPQMLKEADYETAVIGKWHLGMVMGKNLSTGMVRSNLDRWKLDLITPSCFRPPMIVFPVFISRTIACGISTPRIRFMWGKFLPLVSKAPFILMEKMTEAKKGIRNALGKP